MTRAWSRSIFPLPYIWRFTSLSLVIWPSVWPLDQGEVIAALTAAWSLLMPLANAATRLGRARPSQGSRSAGDFLRIMAWKAVMISRAATRTGTPPSIAATVTVSDLDRLSRPMVGHEPRDRAGRG